MTRRTCLATVLVAVLALGVAIDAAWVEAQITLKAVAVSRPTPQFGLWTWLGGELEKRTNGQLKLDVVSLPELGLTGFELVRVTKAGLVDIADVLPTYVAGDLPGLYPDLETSVKAHQAFMPAVKKY